MYETKAALTPADSRQDFSLFELFVFGICQCKGAMRSAISNFLPTFSNQLYLYFRSVSHGLSIGGWKGTSVGGAIFIQPLFVRRGWRGRQSRICGRRSFKKILFRCNWSLIKRINESRVLPSSLIRLEIYQWMHSLRLQRSIDGAPGGINIKFKLIEKVDGKFEVADHVAPLHWPISEWTARKQEKPDDFRQV